MLKWTYVINIEINISVGDNPALSINSMRLVLIGIQDCPDNE